jgi:hypothetical protein
MWEKIVYKGVKLLVSVDISTHAPWITLNEQHIMTCTSTKLMNSLAQTPGDIAKLYWDARFLMS